MQLVGCRCHRHASTDRSLSLWWLRPTDDELLPAGFDDTSTTYFLQPGIERKWHALGKTTIFGEYRKDEAGASVGSNASGSGVGTINTRGADLTFYAGGVVQNIEAAAMDLYVIYRMQGDYISASTARRQGSNIDDFDMVISGARIQF